jgi:hypothetical protein
MMFAVPVRAERRALLGAVTHVDGTARVQTVTCASNPKFWRLLRAFAACTGVPVLLNTPFHNHVEPIVDSVTDAVTTFLTTGIDVLVAGDYVVRKAAPLDIVIDRLVPSIPAHLTLKERDPGGGPGNSALYRDFPGPPVRVLTRESVSLLVRADGRTPIAGLLDQAAAAGNRDETSNEMSRLWAERLVCLRPPAAVLA